MKKKLRIVKNWMHLDVQKIGFHKKGHISENMSPTDLRQVSKFSLGRYLKLFPWHPKDLVGRKNILGESKIFSFNSICIFLASFKMNGFHGKWHNSVIMCPTDLRQGSKFSLIQYLKLIPWHPKDLVSRKKGFRRAEKVDINFWSPFISAIFHRNGLKLGMMTF